ncbi:hypothetical protein [Actinoplanes auranticolor]|uniref:Uncharacterized protein n=1 Tax=Actinoplanes auranticolor TaxID=47988 RepID=A0A919SYQ6_9ACTN|nr:hypothetical protein [Actinoplanes auranticolor]GIM79817.1 hypothetical protein Aau02nite_87630 [Actinoplanes auranticolor]
MRGALIAVGAILMGYALLGAVTDPDLKPGGVLLFLAAVLVAHDAVLLPVTMAGGALLGRFAPRWALPSIRAAGIVSVAVGVVSLPLVLGYGRSADNPSILPLAYGRGLLLVLATTWAAALAAAVLVRRRAEPTADSPALRSKPAESSRPLPAPSTEKQPRPSTGAMPPPSTEEQPRPSTGGTPPPSTEEQPPSSREGQR